MRLTMRNHILGIAIALTLAACCMVAFAQSFEAYQSFKGTKQGKYKGG